MSTVYEAAPVPAWTTRRFVWFKGMFDSRIKTGEDYPTQTLAKLFAMRPGDKAKGMGLACIPSSYANFDAREHAAQRERGSYIALTGDVDSGDHPIETIRDAVTAFAGDAAWLLYTSAHARPGDMRWRIILPLADEQPFEAWNDAQCGFFAFMESRGIAMDHALARAAQPVYLPNVPHAHKSGVPLRGEDGKPLHYTSLHSGLDAPGLLLGDGPVAQGIAALRHKRLSDEQLRETIRREAEARRAASPRGDGASILEDFNAANSVAAMLEVCGYEQSPRHGEDWRSPHQTSGTYATRVIGSKWVSLSASDAAAGLGERCAAGCYGDAYDLFVHYKHGGDHKAAYRALHAERRAGAGNVIYPPQFDPPEWMNEAPGYEEMPEWAGDMPESEGDFDAVIVPHSDKPRLPFFWFHEAAPNLDANDFVEGLLTTGAMSVIYGPSNCGKTFFVVDLALHVAWGRDWRGRAVDRGAIVYLSLEGAQGINNRLSAFRQYHDIPGEHLPFATMPQPVNLLDNEADVESVIELALHVSHESGLPVSMVIIDTLSRAMAGGNENSPEDMTALIGNCDRIRHATGSHVCIVHHSGKDDAKGARGHSSLRAATDTEIEIKRDPELTFSSVRIAKQRDLEAAAPFAFTLQGIALGTNRRSKDVTSCVVVETDQTVAIGRDPDRPSPKETQSMEALNDCLIAGGFELEIGQKQGRDMGVTQAVTAHAWKRSLQARNVIDRDNDNNARTQFRRIKQALVKKGYIVNEGDYVWLA